MISPTIIKNNVRESLLEDIGGGDITAELIDQNQLSTAHVISREPAIICGQDWFNEVFFQLDPAIAINWLIKEGEKVSPNQKFVELSGNSRSLLTGERTALNWLQSLSGTATVVSDYVAALKNTTVKLLDTRKTIPGLRAAQKYAVKIGGGQNHRMGLFDAFLIKENHIASCGSITKAVLRARQNHPDKLIEVEVENFSELQEALNSKVNMIMLDNFNLENMEKSVSIVNKKSKLEVSGNVDLNTIKKIAETGIDFISVGALTKHLRAIDLSMRFEN